MQVGRPQSRAWLGWVWGGSVVVGMQQGGKGPGVEA